MSEQEANPGEGLGAASGPGLSGAALRHLPDGVLVVRVRDRRILEVNPAFARMVRRQPEELVDQPLELISVDPEALDRLMRQVEKKATGQDPWTQQIKLRRGDGETCWARARTTRYDDPQHGAVWVSLQQELTDERRMLARLEEQERLLSTVWEHFPIGMVQFDRMGAVYRSNATAAALWPWGRPIGGSQPRQIPMWWPDGTPINPDDSPLAHALRGEATEGKLLRFRTPDQEIRSTRVTALPLRDPADNPDGALLLWEEITENERELALLRELLGRTGEAVLVLDVNQGIRYANKTAQTLLLGAAIPLDLPIGTFVTGESLATFVTAHHEVLNDGEESQVHRLELTAASGRSFLAEVRFIRIRGLAGARPMVGVLARNIELTEAHLLDQRLLAEAGELFATSLDPEETLEHLVQLLFAVGADCFCIDLLEDGRSRRRRVGAVQRNLEPLLATLGPPLNPEVSALARQVLDEESLISSASYPAPAMEVLYPDASDLKVASTLGLQGWILVPLIARGRSLGIITVLLGKTQEDRTRREYLLRNLAARAALAMENARLFSEAQAATVSREQLLRVVAHDLRTPLQSVRLASELTLRKLNDGQVPAAGPIEAIGRAALRMDRLIGDLVDWARIGTGSLSVELAPIDVPSVLDEVMETVRPSVAQHQLERRVLPRIPEVMGDRMRLIQVLVNLVSNALKFTPPGGRVTLSASAMPTGGVLFAVDDEGPGLDAEQQARIFEPFTQLASGDRRGLGLGLTISQGLVEAQGGHIEVRSNPGHGSRFFFVLPLVPG